MSVASSTSQPNMSKGGKGVNVALWVVQCLLVLPFTAVGTMKIVWPISKLAQNWHWVASLPVGLVRFIGFAELAGVLGLILPSLTRIQPKLTPLAAAGLATIVLLGAGLHILRGETPVIGINLILAALAIFVAWGRWKKAPIAPRS